VALEKLTVTLEWRGLVGDGIWATPAIAVNVTEIDCEEEVCSSIDMALDVAKDLISEFWGQANGESDNYGADDIDNNLGGGTD
jgi:hypothetical protein